MSKVRVQITLEDTLLNSLDSYCVKNYINRSAALSFMASQFLMRSRIEKIDMSTVRSIIEELMKEEDFYETTSGISY